MNKRVCFIVVIVFCLPILAFARRSNSNNDNYINNLPITLLNNLGGFGGRDNMLMISTRVKDGVVNVRTANLQKIKPKNLFFKGVVSSIADYSVTFTREGVLDYIKGKGAYVFGTVINADKKIIRRGSVIASLNKEEIEKQVKSALKRKKLSDMSYDYIRKMTKAQENLAKKNIITTFALEQAQMEMYSNLLLYESTVKKTDSLLLSSKDPNVYSTRSGLITEVFASVGDKILPGTLAAKLMQMDPILIKIPCPVELLNFTHKKEAVKVYAAGNNHPITAMLELRQDDPRHIFVHVPNKIIVSSKLTSRGKGMPKVFSVFPVKNLLNKELESFYLSSYQQKSKQLVVPTVSLRHDNSEFYVYKIKNCSLTDKGGEIPKYFQIEKIPVSLGGISTNLIYGVDKPELVRSIIDNGAIKVGDVLIGNAQDNLEDGDDVVLLERYWKFYPEQEVRVLIPTLTKQGIYVPRKAVIHQDENENFVYLVENEVAKLKKIHVLGAFESYCLISGKDIASGGKVIIVDDPILFTLLYDGRKVNSIESEEAPIFMEKKHAIDYGWSTKSKDTFNTNNSNMRKKYSSGRYNKGNFNSLISRGILSQMSEMF